MERPYVLIAHDNERIRNSLFEFVDRTFDVIGVVVNGEELVEVARVLRPDVIVSDITLPQVDGLAARNRLIGHGRLLPFVFVSALDKEVVRLLSIEVADGPAAAFVHEIDIYQHLLRAIEEVFRGRQYISPYYRD